MTITNLPADVAELRGSVKEARKAEADCPANKRSLGDNACPICRAGLSDDCGLTSPRYYGSDIHDKAD